MIQLDRIDLNALPFCEFEVKENLPPKSGIYFAIDSQNVVQYIGMSQNLNSRWASHTRLKEFKKQCGLRIAYLLVDEEELLPGIESALISWYQPPLNGTLREKSPEDCSIPHRVNISDEDARAFGKKLQLLRSLANLSQYQLAEIVGCSNTLISKLEKGKDLYEPGDRLIDSMAAAIGCHRLELYLALGRLPKDIVESIDRQAIENLARLRSVDEDLFERDEISVTVLVETGEK